MREVSDISAVAHVIQLSVAPVFLLTGIGSLLTVMTNRLARLIDRARLLEGKLEAGHELADQYRRDLDTLSTRAKLIGKAIALCTLTALLVCAVIAILFLGAFLRWDVSMAVVVLFVSAMLGLVIGLLCFLDEIFIATRALRIGMPKDRK